MAAFLILHAQHQQFSAPAPDEQLPVLNHEHITVFHHPQCQHCKKALSFLKQQEKINIPITALDITTPHGQHLFHETVRYFTLDPNLVGVPLFVYRNDYHMGFDTAETTGVTLLAWIRSQPESYRPSSRKTITDTVKIPLMGDISLTQTSLPLLTILLGIADGFNPCAMWVLLYLISVIASLHDQRKIWLLVGSFVFASGVLYFLFMTAWLNTFLFIGYTYTLTLLIGLCAIGFGINQLYELVATRGVVACKVDAPEDRQATMTRINQLVSGPVTLITLTGIVSLAFAVNIIEFVCSAALPAIYTHTLSLLELPPLSYYLYIMLYVFFFMLDDLIIFAAAAFAVHKLLDSKYAAYSRAVSSILLVILGSWMLAY